jgi:hypothetical protein
MSDKQTIGTPRKLLPDWYVAVGGLLLVLFVIFNLAYRLGAGGVRFYGGTASFNRQFDHQLFKIDDTRAFLVHGESVAVVKYASAYAPFRLVCGSCTPDGSVLNLADYRKGDWVYSRYPEFEGPDVYNLRTQEVITLDVPRPKGTARVEPAKVPFYAEHGFTFDEALALTPEKVAKEFETLSTMNESCLTFNAAFYLLFALMLLVGAPLLIKGLLRARKAAG